MAESISDKCGKKEHGRMMTMPMGEWMTFSDDLDKINLNVWFEIINYFYLSCGIRSLNMMIFTFFLCIISYTFE